MFIVKNMKTGKYLPPLKSMRSATTQELSDIPRVFTSRGAAILSARWWAAGQAGWSYEYGVESGFLEGSELVSTPVKGRRLSDLRIIPVRLNQGKPQKIPEL